MARHFHEELGDLKQKLITMSRLAEYTIQNAVEGLTKRNPHFAELVFAKERVVNLMEIEIDDIGHSLLALAQPMAADLRMVTTILKINTELERIADHAVNIAERVQLILHEPEYDIDAPIPQMAENVQHILKDAVESFIQENVELAKSVLRRDDEIDNYNDTIYKQIEDLIQTTPSLAKTGMKLVRIGHDLERIGDLANNIAEDVVYMKQGKEVRHRVTEFL
jgi:phosphate transport system protein